MPLDDPFDLSADLPPPHDEEPDSLRQDILDELADHLACALRRETMISSDTSQAQTNVLQRFGNPAKVARKLWWDAMWEKIMMQRITLVASLLSVIFVACIGVIVARTTERVKDSQQFLLAQQKLFNESVLEQLKTVTQPNVVPNEWVPLEVLLRDESDQPVQGTVYIRTDDKTSQHPQINLNAKTNERGIAQMGQIPWGNYQFGVVLDDLKIQTTWKELIRPGTSPEMKIICPVSVPEPTFEAKFDPPEELISPQRFYLAKIRQKLQGEGRDWDILPQPEVTAILDSQGECLGQTESSQWQMKRMRGPVSDGRISINPPGSPPQIVQDIYSPRANVILSAFKNSGMPLTADNMFGRQSPRDPFDYEDSGRQENGDKIVLHSFHTGTMKLRGNRFQVTLTSEFNAKILNEDQVPKELAQSDPKLNFLVSLPLLPLDSENVARGYYSIGLDSENRLQLDINSTDPVWEGFRRESQEYAKLFYKMFAKKETASQSDEFPASEGFIRPSR
ncbi:MAG TPA: hypothetical protein VNQ76_18630 [Planctomicrobium sp.]|nr:hypothetical protein [Planctomicrobium sp.]